MLEGDDYHATCERRGPGVERTPFYVTHRIITWNSGICGTLRRDRCFHDQESNFRAPSGSVAPQPRHAVLSTPKAPCPPTWRFLLSRWMLSPEGGREPPWPPGNTQAGRTV